MASDRRKDQNVVHNSAQLELETQNTEHAGVEEQFTRLTANSLLGVCIHRKNRFLYANQAFADLYRYSSPEEVLAVGDVIKFWAPTEQAHILKYYQERISGGTPPVQFELRGLRKDGSLIWVENHVQVIDWKGQQAILVTTLDISERKQAKEDLEKSEEKFRNLVEGSNQGVIVHTDKPIFVNKAASDLFGYDSPEDMLKIDNIEEIFAPNLRPGMLERRKARFRGEDVPTQFEFQGIRKDGNSVWVDASVRVVSWEGNQAIQCTYNDISERKRAEEELENSQYLMQTILDTVPTWLFVKDREGSFKMVNKAMAEFYECLPEDFINKQYRNFAVSNEESQSSERSDRQTVETGQETRVADFLALAPSGSITFRQGVKLPLTDATGQVVGIVGASIDITENKRAEEALKASEARLRQAQKMESVGQLAGGVAHDFNNMLQIIGGYTQIALSRDGISDNITADLQKVLKGSESAADLTRQLLVFSRQNVLSLRDLDINDLIINLMKLMGRLLGAELELQVVTGEGLGYVHGDPGMIEQVLMNLCVNARDALPEGGRLVVETRNFAVDEAQCKAEGWENPGDYVLISVADNGTGISKEALPNIFDPFFTTKEAEKGTGLGLSVVHGIVNQHHGRITVYSELGQGTTFNIFLPVAESPEVGMAEQNALPVAGGTETILVADDEAVILQLTTELLEDQGYTVFAACDGEEAVRIFNDHPSEIALALLDLSMPKLNGRGVYDEIHPRYPKLPFIFDSGFPSSIMDKDFFESSNSTLIQKPFTPSTLLHAVREALDRD